MVVVVAVAVHSPLATAAEQEPDRCLRSILAYGLRPWRLCQALKLRQDYGIRVRAIGRYSCPERSRGGSPLPAGVSVSWADKPHAKDAAATQRLVDTPT